MKNIYRFILISLICADYSPSALAQNRFFIPSSSTACGAPQTLVIPIKVNNLTNVGSMQFTLSFDPNRFTYGGHSAVTPAFTQGSGTGAWNDMTFIANGMITFSWTRLGGLTIPGDTTIFTITLNYLGGGSGSVGYLLSGPTPFEVTDPNSNTVSFTQSGAVISSSDTANPTVSCPASVSTTSNTPVTLPGLDATNVTDNCGVTGRSFVVTAPTSASGSGTSVSAVAFVPGLSTVTYTVSDAAGNTATCSFQVQVTSSSQSDTLTLIASPGPLACGQSNYYVDILVNAFDSIGSLQYTLKWNESIFRFDSISMTLPALALTPANFNVMQSGQGLFGFSWTTNSSQNYLNLPDGTRILRLHFTVLNSGNINSSVTFTGSPVPIEAYNNATPPGFEVPVLTQGAVVSIADTTKPALTCPPSQLLMAGQSQTSVPVTGLIAIATDNCDPTPTFSYQIVTNGNSGPLQSGANANGNYTVGMHTVVFTVVDDAGNSSVCFTNVQVSVPNSVVFYVDSLEVGCSGNTTVDVSVRVRNFADVVGTQFVLIWDEAILDFDTIVFIAPGINSQPFNFGNFASTNNGLLQYIDGNIGGWPNIPDGGAFFTMRFKILASGQFNAPIRFISLPGFPFQVYDMNVNLLNAVSIDGAVTSSDNTPPVFTVCPANVTVNTPGLECTVSYNWPQVSATDNCGTVSLDSNMVSRTFSTGNHLVVYTATDQSGNVATCSFNIFVKDNRFPEFITPCPANITVNAGTNCSATANWTAPTAFDACDQLVLPVMSSFTPGQTFAAGPTIVTYTATDQSGNSISCSFTVNVIETVAPTVDCPADTTIVISNNACMAAVTWPNAVAQDNCGGQLNLQSDVPNGSSLPTGFTIVEYTATDASGNTATCSFVVTVIENTAPTIDCPANLTTSVDDSQPGQCGGVATWATAVASDNCSAVTVIPTIQPGSYLSLGTHTIRYTASDASGNTATCTFTVTVEDKAPPILTCPPPQSFTLAPDQCSAIVSWQEPTLADIVENCGIATFFTVGNFDSPDTLVVGNYAITYIAIDNAGNFGQCVFNVMIRDTVPPVLSGCPNDSVVVTNGCFVPFNFTLPTGSDNCDNNVSVTVAPANGSLLPAGSTTTFVVVGVDNYQNRDTCQFTVQVTGGTSASVTCPNNITQIGCSWTAAWAQPTTTGFCNQPVNVTATPYDIGAVIPSGIHTIVYTATDASGTSASCSFTVTVNDQIPPQFNCPQNVVVDVSGGITSDPSDFVVSATPGANCSNVSIIYAAVTATDNCGTVNTTQTSGPVSGGTFNEGVTTMTFLATDGVNNTVTCSFTVTVNDITDSVSLVATPNPACPGQPLLISAPAISGATYQWSGPGSDYPNAPVIMIDPVTPAAAGNYAVTITNNGCVYTAGAGVAVTVGTQPVAGNDFFPILVSQSDTFNLLANDTQLGAGVEVELINAPPGVTQLANGLIFFAGTPTAGDLVFTYELCSEACDLNCSVATVTINIKESICNFIPNLITPNQDDLNDEWLIPCLEFDAYPQNSVVIYNQWGDVVFEASPYKPFPKTTAWKGTLHGDSSKPLPDGVYFYIFRPTPTAAPIKGFIEIYR